MWIVKLALRRPYTFVVMSVMLIIAGIGTTLRLPKDIFPVIKEPTVTILWQYPGFDANSMANEVTEWSEFLTSQFVTDIRRMESRNVFGYGLMRLYFHPRVDVDRALAQVTATSQTILKRIPLGTNPPFVLIYDPSSAPVMLVVLASQTLTEAQLFDYGQFTVRQGIAARTGGDRRHALRLRRHPGPGAGHLQPDAPQLAAAHAAGRRRAAGVEASCRTARLQARS
jgi:multidrug efflux pump subunit AcrB